MNWGVHFRREQSVQHFLLMPAVHVLKCQHILSRSDASYIKHKPCRCICFPVCIAQSHRKAMVQPTYGAFSASGDRSFNGAREHKSTSCVYSCALSKQTSGAWLYIAPPHILRLSISRCFVRSENYILGRIDARHVEEHILPLERGVVRHSRDELSPLSRYV